MIRTTLAVAALALLTACGDGQPFFDEATDGTGGTGGTGTDQPVTPPTTGTLGGTVSPQADTSVVRFEADNTNGGGYVSSVTYDPAKDVFTVDNLGFDGANVYQPLNVAPVIRNGTRVFAADAVVKDFLTGKPVNQIVPYRALYRASDVMVDGKPMTMYSIVRTGGYKNLGFGGFVMERSGGVKMPTTGQAGFSGKYAGVRIFGEQSGLEYTTGDMNLQIDFEDFNSAAAVKGALINRQAYNEDGSAIPVGTGDGQLPMPVITWAIQGDHPIIDRNGEIEMDLFSNDPASGTNPQPSETGKFNGLLAGDTTTGKGGQIVGIIVLNSTDPRYNNMPVQETGGVILNR